MNSNTTVFTSSSSSSSSVSSSYKRLSFFTTFFSQLLLFLLLLEGVSARPTDPPFSVTTVRLFGDKNFTYEMGRNELLNFRDSGCITMPQAMRRHLWSYSVDNGCCEFFSNMHCKSYGHMFTAINRKHAMLPSYQIALAESYRCNHRTCSES